ncbi:MAG: uroporphyrinogen decarboxylase family protein [Candidatus Lokiarchaeota archaeon]
MVNKFLKVLNGETNGSIPLYCTGYPEHEFIIQYRKKYSIYNRESDMILNKKDYSNKTNHSTKVDGWGRVFKGDWYTWEGVFKNPEILDNWKYLILPSNEKIEKLKKFLSINRKDLNYILSLPGLFEKTWQSMGFVFFSKCLKKNQELIFKVVKFFHTYIENLVKSLKKANVKVFLIADDLGYKNRTFLPKDIWEFFFLQDYMDLVEYIKKDNESNVILHSDGYISSMMDLFIEIGFDAQHF